MAIEAKRGCGYRKVGGLYMVGGKLSAPCDRLPWQLDICPTCGGGIKFARGWTWIEPFSLLEGTHAPKAQCQCFMERVLIRPIDEHLDYEYANCPVCSPLEFFGETGKAGLLWIGEQFYKTPGDFLKEGTELGISRRINSIPRGFKLGETWIFFAHIKAVHPLACKVAADDSFQPNYFAEPEHMKHQPGIFAAFRPTRLERIVKQSEFDLYQYAVKNFLSDNLDYGTNESKLSFSEWIELNYIASPKDREAILKLQSDVNRGITLIPVPDDDPDHQA